VSVSIDECDVHRVKHEICTKFRSEGKTKCGKEECLKINSDDACSSYLWLWRNIFKEDVVSWLVGWLVV